MFADARRDIRPLDHKILKIDVPDVGVPQLSLFIRPKTEAADLSFQIASRDDWLGWATNQRTLSYAGRTTQVRGIQVRLLLVFDDENDC